MKTIETKATVTPDGKVTVQLPADIPPGEHQIVLVIDEKTIIDNPFTKKERPPLDFPVHDCGVWPVDLSLRREDMYDDLGQ